MLMLTSSDVNNINDMANIHVNLGQDPRTLEIKELLPTTISDLITINIHRQKHHSCSGVLIFPFLAMGPTESYPIDNVICQLHPST